MIKIPIKKVPFAEVDENGQMVEGFRGEPETPVFPLSVYYPNATGVKCDGEFYTVWEPGDV